MYRLGSPLYLKDPVHSLEADGDAAANRVAGAAESGAPALGYYGDRLLIGEPHYGRDLDCVGRFYDYLWWVGL